MDKLFIIDGNSLINRAFYALPPLAASDGKVYNAVYGFMNIMLRLITEHNPTYLIVAFDVGRKTFRHAIYADYKGTRKGMPPELAAQMPLLKGLLKDMNVMCLEQEGVEADDIIGTISKRFDVPRVIVTGDRDCLQLINETNTVWLTKHGISEIVEMNERHLKEEMGLVPSQIIDLKALMGDASDNIPGVKGVGEKTALGLLAEYGTLDNIYDNINAITGKTKEKLQNDKQMAYLSHVLATIKTDVTIPCELCECTYQFPLSLAVYKKFEAYEFKSLLKRADLFAGEFVSEKPKQAKIKEVIIETEPALEKLIAECLGAKKLSLNFGDSLNISLDGKTEYVVKLQRDLIPEGIKLERAFEMLSSVFNNNQISKIVYCKKDILKKLEFYNVSVSNITFDISLAVYLVNSNVRTDKPERVFEFLDLPIETPASALFLAREILNKKLSDKNLNKLYFDLELPLEDILISMEHEGIKIDVAFLNELGKKLDIELTELIKSIYIEAGVEFNINSPKQLGEVLFDRLGLSTAGNKKQSTAVDILESLSGAHPIIPLMLRYRKISKLSSTYVEGFKPFINAQTHKIHTTFNQTLTLTGRLSSNEPNLQNIPIRSDEGRILRKMFIASDEDRKLLSADYSQIELRLLAHYSQDKNLVKAYKDGQDIHAITASEIFDKPLDKVTENDRRNAKAVNFGIIYGISAYGLANNTGIDAKDAKMYIDKYFETYPTIRSFLDSSVAEVKSKGYVTTLLGRIRNIDEVFSSNRNVSSFGERAAMNMPLQGSASDIIKLAMINVTRELAKHKLDAKLILQIHDELILDVASSDVKAVAKIIKKEMESVIKLNVPLVVDISAGSNWLEMALVE